MERHTPPSSPSAARHHGDSEGRHLRQSMPAAVGRESSRTPQSGGDGVGSEPVGLRVSQTLRTSQRSLISVGGPPGGGGGAVDVRRTATPTHVGQGDNRALDYGDLSVMTNEPLFDTLGTRADRVTPAARRVTVSSAVQRTEQGDTVRSPQGKRRLSRTGINKGTTIRTDGGTQDAGAGFRFKVTEDVKRLIETRLSSSASAPGPKHFLKFTSAFDRQNYDSRRSPHVTDEVDAFVELICGDIVAQDTPTLRMPGRLWSVILDPHSTKARLWYGLMLVTITYCAFSIPFRAAWSSDRHNRALYVTIDAMCMMTFIVDVIINFFTGFYHEEMILQTDFWAIAYNYLRSWFLLDVIAAIPIEATSSMWSMIRLVKMLRIPTYASHHKSKTSRQFSSPAFKRIGYLVVMVIWYWHFMACMYWFVSETEGLGQDDWVAPALLLHENIRVKYLYALDWTLQTTFSFNTIARPETERELAYSVCAVLLGLVLTCTIIGSVASGLISVDAEREAMRRRMWKVMNYLRRRKIPPYFQKVVLDYFGYMSDKYQEDAIIQELPATIRARLSLLLNRQLLTHIPLLRSLDLNIIISLMQSLQSRVHLPGDFVFNVGDYGTHLFFIKDGAMDMVLPDGHVAGQLFAGEMAGQVALTEGTNHEFGLRACTYSEVLSMDAITFDELAEESERFNELVTNEAIKQESLVKTAIANLTRFSKLTKVSQFDKRKVGVESPHNRTIRKLEHRASSLPNVNKGRQSYKSSSVYTDGGDESLSIGGGSSVLSSTTSTPAAS